MIKQIQKSKPPLIPGLVNLNLSTIQSQNYAKQVSTAMDKATPEQIARFESAQIALANARELTQEFYSAMTRPYFEKQGG